MSCCKFWFVVLVRVGEKWRISLECGLFRIVNMNLIFFSEEKTRVFRVAELNLAIKQLLESNVPLLWVSGEISNLVKAASGHLLFFAEGRSGTSSLRDVPS